METLHQQFDFNKLCAAYDLGQLTTQPEQIFGGFLHKIYRLTTDRAEYAVKVLNSQIMKRSTAMENYVFAEKVATLAREQGINALPAIVSKGNFMHEVEGQYVLLFPWVDGKPLSSGTIDIDACEKIAGILAGIHRIDFSQLTDEADSAKEDYVPSTVDWQSYALKGEQAHLEWSSMLTEYLNKLQKWEQQANAAGAALMNNKVISHRDLDPKNVLWDNNHVPVIIDWEAAGAVNPMQELIEVALYWSGSETGNVNKDAFRTMISTYRKHGGKIGDNWHDVLNCGFQGKLDWLSYSIKRSLGVESTDAAEQELGTSQVIPTIQAIADYADFIPVCIDWLEEMES
jgi:Ser/Thr protein kinase RdoA (MazF antagonist)